LPTEVLKTFVMRITYPVHSILPYLIAPFSKALKLCFPLLLKGQVSRRYKTTSKVIVLYILIFTFYK
jgi:hypothetical protein